MLMPSYIIEKPIHLRERLIRYTSGVGSMGGTKDYFETQEPALLVADQ